MPEPEVPAPRVVGVDEYATRKGRVYGTVLADVESRRPVDLLPDRESSSLVAWLAKRPGIDRDPDAVIAGPTLPWSSGGVEGHVNRIKMLRHQMFGRAGFALLRKRVLLAE